MLRNVFAGLVLGIAAAPFTAKAVPLPMEAFFKYPQISAAKISPDGKYLAMAVANDKTGLEKSTLVIVATDDLKATGSVSLIGDQSIFDFWWVNDERVLVASQTRIGGFDSPGPDGKLYAVNVDGTSSVELMGDPAKLYSADQFTHLKHEEKVSYFRSLLFVPPDDPKHVVVDVYVDRHAPNQAYLLNTYDGDLRLIGTAPTADGGLLTDNNGEIRLALGGNVKTGVAEFFYRPSQSVLDWTDMSRFYDHDDPAATPLRPLGFTADNKQFYWLGRTATSTLGLYAVDPATGTKQALFEDPDNDVDENPFSGRGGVVWSFDFDPHRHIVAAETMPGFPAIHIIDNDDLKAQLLAELYQAFPNQKVVITSNTRDHSKMVVMVSSDKNPGDFYLFDTKTNKASLLFSAKTEIDPDAMASMQPINFKARDGLPIHGYLTTPSGVVAKNLPMILIVHGGPHGIRDEWGWNPEAQFFASRGYAVLQVNYRGSGGYGMNFQDAGYRHWGTSMQDDLADGVRWAIQQGTADPKRICVYGASYGGYAAFENDIRYPDLYKCIVGYVGLYDLELANEHYYVRHYASGEAAISVELGNDAAELKTYSPVDHADLVKAPAFIIYGGRDMLVVPDNAEEMMKALDKAGKPYERLYEPLEGHGFVQQEHNYELYTKMLAFFDKYIGPDAAKNAPSVK